jgi:uncharacterized protein (TIGR02679 family)
MTPDRPRLERLLGGPALAAFRARLRARFARGSSSEVVTLSRLSRHERETLTGLLGRRTRDASSMRIALAELDDALARAGLAQTLRHALELLDGPIPDLLAARNERERAWASALGDLAEPRLKALVALPASRGLIKRLAGGEPAAASGMLLAAAQILARLPARGLPRSQLAAETLGDAHALDTGRPLATLVLSALREEDDERPRETWARVGVMVNELAKPAFALNLAAEPNGGAGLLVNAAREVGEPVALSLRALLRSAPCWLVRDRDVFVCENANLLAIAADQLGPHCAPLVCTDGMPSASPRTLLRQLAEQGARLRYHGDFDWPGIRIANYVMRTFGASAWRFDAAHYQPKSGRPLRGTPVAARWDAALQAAMLAGGHALDEEAVSTALLEDLERS